MGGGNEDGFRVVVNFAMEEALSFVDCAFLFRWKWWAGSLETISWTGRLRTKGRRG